MKIKHILVIMMLMLLSHCSVYTIATETSGFTDQEKPKRDEGIAVFHFLSTNHTPLPNELYFQSVDSQKTYHFTLSAWVNHQESSRYIFLKKGAYTFKNIVYKFNEKYITRSFPPNSFYITPNHINYLGDILFRYAKSEMEVNVLDNIKQSMWCFYKKYPQLTIKYPLKKNLLVIEKPLESLFILN